MTLPPPPDAARATWGEPNAANDAPPESSPVPVAGHAVVSRDDEERVGPGLAEAILWIAGFFAIEIFGSAVWAAGASLYRVANGLPLTTDPQVLLGPVMVWMIGSTKLLEALCALAAIRLRYGRTAFPKVGFRPIPVPHAVILVFALLPVAMLAGQSYVLFQGYWPKVVELFPSLHFFDETSSVEAVQRMAGSTSWLALVLIVAVLPALNEEFLFRAAIGTGLVNRYGVVLGIWFTSVLFSAVHIAPTQAAALIPLAVLLHVGYLSSGSLWWPVTLHFLNNALSVTLMKLAAGAPKAGGDLGGVAEVAETQFLPLVFAASLACVAATCWLLWAIRVARPDDGDRRASRAHWPVAPIATAGVCYALFPVAVVVNVWLRYGA